MDRLIASWSILVETQCRCGHFHPVESSSGCEGQITEVSVVGSKNSSQGIASMNGSRSQIQRVTAGGETDDPQSIDYLETVHTELTKKVEARKEACLVLRRSLLQSEARELLLFTLEWKEDFHKATRARRLKFLEYKNETEEMERYTVELKKLLEKLAQ